MAQAERHRCHGALPFAGQPSALAFALSPLIAYCQVRLVRHMLRSASLRDVKVGTVDDYQGQEGKVIFVSTTVSRRYGFADLSQDSTAVSFIGSPQRFNVAVSRAQHMLVVVGDPWVLNIDR